MDTYKKGCKIQNINIMKTLLINENSMIDFVEIY